MVKKAFIAAPLIGTLIFLVCILVIINMGRAEESAVADIASDAYHNRLVSIVEIYRSDLGSVFNIGLQKNIEYGLTSRCWYNFFPLSTKKKLTNAVDSETIQFNRQELKEDYDGDLTITLEEERYFRCAKASELVHEVVCSKSAGPDYLFSLSSWAKILKEKTNFEGVSLETANAAAFDALINDVSTNADVTLCDKLIPVVEMDCKAYSESGEFQCCKQFEADGSCKIGSETQGCENGDQFFIRLSIENPDIYPKFPRVLAQDTAGNKIRAGAISDKDYDVPITYPLYKYMDAAFEFNQVLAFGKNGQEDTGAGGDVGAERGIAEGSCLGAASADEGCNKVNLFMDIDSSIDFGPDNPFDSGDAAKEKFAQIYFQEVLGKACKTIQDPAPYNYTVSMNVQNTNLLIGESKTCGQVLADPSSLDFSNALGIQSVDCPNPKQCAYIPEVNLELTFIDNDLTTQVSADKKNEFCWRSISKYAGP